MTTMNLSHTRLLPERLADYADVELVDVLRLLLQEAQKRGPLTLADIRSLKLEIADYAADDGFTENTLRVEFRMDKEVAP